MPGILRLGEFTSKAKNPILFFDTYIVAGVGDKGGYYGNESVKQGICRIRDEFPAYAWREKIDVVKYTLSSYAAVPWDSVVIRFECEDSKRNKEFYEFCRLLFPSAIIENERSDTALKYISALNRLVPNENPWVFFCPNNDHPFIGPPKSIEHYVNYAENIERKYEGKNVSILYSHFTESMNDNRITDSYWGYAFGNRKRILLEDQYSLVTSSNLASLDSIKIFRKNFILDIFKRTANVGRVIRLEDTEFHLSKGVYLITINPKIELCRHYDGYTHLMNTVPPLSIPPGFFDKQVKVRVGYEDIKPGWLNLNPYSVNLYDFDCPFSEGYLPDFYSDYVIEIDINSNPERKAFSEINYLSNLYNPDQKSGKLMNLLGSGLAFLSLKYRLSVLVNKIANFIRNIRASK